MRRRAVFVLVLLLSASSAKAQERTISWKALDVSARLEAGAQLSVVERHTMIFNGDWNGGERTFRLDPGQQINGVEIRRIDSESGEPILLRRGDLSQVDNWNWSGGSLRWRTRLPSDPTYLNKTLIFEIAYTLSGIVDKRPIGQYQLDHDFAFPDRQSPIERFTLKFEADPVWQADAVPAVEKFNLPPGESVVLHLPMTYTGQGEPAFIYRPPPPPPPAKPPLRMHPIARAVGVAALFAIFSFLLIGFVRHENSAGRFESWQPPLPSDEAWLQRNVLAYPAEVVGAAWDESSGEAEVSALLARLIQEGKIKAESRKVNEQVSLMELRLMAPRSEFQEHEQALVKALFVSGDVIDRAKLRTHYQSTGFNPAATLRTPLMKKVERMTSRAFGPPATASRNAGVILTVAIILNFFLSFIFGCSPILYGSLAAACLITGRATGHWYRRKLLGITGALLVWAPLLFLALVTALVAHPALFAIFAAETLCLTWYVLRKAQWPGSREFLEWRRNLIAARDWFKFELSKPEPQLKDEWTPYLIAFGLSGAMDEWANSFGAPRPVSTLAPDRDRGFPTTPAMSPRIPVKPSPPIWTGGGGAFGGAGASGGWAREVTSLAAAVAPPRSSYSSGGGSSSSSSRSSFSSSSSSSRSGGGGGGGW